MSATITRRVQPHNEQTAKVWSSGGAHYDRISYGIVAGSGPLC